MRPKLYHELYGCKCSHLDPSICTCRHDTTYPEYIECCECGEYLLSGDKVFSDNDGDPLCEDCYKIFRDERD